MLGIHLPVSRDAHTHSFAVLGELTHQVQTLDANGVVLSAGSNEERIQLGPLLLEGADLLDHVAKRMANAGLGLALEEREQEGVN